LFRSMAREGLERESGVCIMGAVTFPPSLTAGGGLKRLITIETRRKLPAAPPRFGPVRGVGMGRPSRTGRPPSPGSADVGRDVHSGPGFPGRLPMRLDKLVAERFGLSRRAAQDVVRNGRIDVAGQRCDEPGCEVEPGTPVAFFPGRPKARTV